MLADLVHRLVQQVGGEGFMAWPTEICLPAKGEARLCRTGRCHHRLRGGAPRIFLHLLDESCVLIGFVPYATIERRAVGFESGACLVGHRLRLLACGEITALRSFACGGRYRTSGVLLANRRTGSG